MKKFCLITGLMLASCLCWAGPDIIPFTSSSVWSGALVTVSSTMPVSGYIEDIFVDVPMAYTATVVVASQNETFLTNAVSADKMFSTAKPITYSDGSTTWTNALKRYLVIAETLTVKISSAAATTNRQTVSVQVRINDK